MKLIARQLLLTLAYTTQFGFPLKRAELAERYVLSSSAQEKNSLTRASISESLEYLVSNEFIAQKEEFVFFPGNESAVVLRKLREASSAQKILELQPIITLAQWLPWVVGVAVTGSAAMGNANPDDDADLLIVTHPNRLWLTRPLFIFCAFMYGKRRSWQKEEKNSWCFNLWLEESSMAQAPQTHSIYIAYEVCQTLWLVSKNHCHEDFLLENAWVKKYLPFYFKNRLDNAQRDTQAIAPIRLSLVSWCVDQLNTVCYLLQRWYMQSHMTRERVTKNHAFFHPRDTRRVVKLGLQEVISSIGEA